MLADDEICEIEKNFVNYKLKTLTVYFGDLCQPVDNHFM
jgi:hypothetical protein